MAEDTSKPRNRRLSPEEEQSRRDGYSQPKAQESSQDQDPYLEGAKMARNTVGGWAVAGIVAGAVFTAAISDTPAAFPPEAILEPDTLLSVIKHALAGGMEICQEYGGAILAAGSTALGVAHANERMKSPESHHNGRG